MNRNGNTWTLKCRTSAEAKVWEQTSDCRQMIKKISVSSHKITCEFKIIFHLVPFCLTSWYFGKSFGNSFCPCHSRNVWKTVVNLFIPLDCIHLLSRFLIWPALQLPYNRTTTLWTFIFTCVYVTNKRWGLDIDCRIGSRFYWTLGVL